jgi:hypothetical protein
VLVFSDINSIMAAKPKKVTYKDPAEDNADYLVPLQYETTISLPHRTKSSDKPIPQGGLFGSIYLPIALLLYVGVPISQFVIGLIYIGQCTVRQFISPYMILSGAFGIAFVAVGLIIYMQIQKQASASASYDGPQPNLKLLRILIPIFILLFIFVIGWFIAGHVIVLEVKLRVELFDPTLPEYCHGNLYKPAYIFIFVDYLILLIGILLCVISCMGPPESKEDANKKRKRPVRPPRK